MVSRQSQDLADARRRSGFDITTLSDILWPENRRQVTDRLVDILSKEPILDKDTRRHLSRQELLNHGYKIQLRLVELKRKHNWDHDTFLSAMHLVDDHVPYGLHFNAFMPVLQSQGSDEQIAAWLPRCESLEVIGCYAQTELGHGSNVQGLETSATFDRDSQSFIIDSPTLTSAKWWVGGLGTVANHAVVQAQLIIAGKNLGPHLFIVPIRDLKTHVPLAGVEVGDIGPKHYGGFNMNDNGFARFDKVKIPAANFLCRYAKVDSEGKYSPAGHAKIGYGSMVALRAGMPVVLGLELGKCVTIAVRYTTARRQFKSTGPQVTDKLEDAGVDTSRGQDTGEMQVIKYNSVKERLVPLLAASYCYILAGHSTMTLYRKMLAALVAPPHDASALAEVHLLTAGLKAVLSWNVVAGMEESRKALGGHGFSIYSGIGERFAKEVPGQTYEGDNYVLVQQTARGLLKNMSLLMSGKVSAMMPSTRFLASLPRHDMRGPIDWTDRQTHLSLLGLAAAATLKDLGRKTQDEAWAELNMDCVRVTRTFIDHYVATLFHDRVESPGDLPDATRTVLRRLVDVHVLHALTSAVPVLAEFNLLPNDAVSGLFRARKDAINALQHDLVGLTDAFGFTDWELNSILGRHDGNVYEELWRTVNEKNPVNTERVNGVVRGWEALLKPLHETAKAKL
ncbi:Acyl-CoA oxidase [Taphrina deformans PYCC 5710]|uniref:Acyl-coenzyme A oxidase n=1 Tax=Taphrina deformans (strain PYCC 5710 / ATCC 11124 / CBS 356.35 / IMI 108563 / JCM 9778 / NBRC 8474) TaxID=1097556 RepID=R4XCE6_TAPDE|nr:Acyl-CoA oxidase [Taphrina deformans PYCC 5710]|eukprot:CCG80995.1 Acyl-CoA oxidase [Taphrina deformans PYCC 5710]